MPVDISSPSQHVIPSSFLGFFLQRRRNQNDYARDADCREPIVCEITSRMTSCVGLNKSGYGRQSEDFESDITAPANDKTKTKGIFRWHDGKHSGNHTHTHTKENKGKKDRKKDNRSADETPPKKEQNNLIEWQANLFGDSNGS